MKKKIAVVTGTRAEYGLLSPLLDKLEKNDSFELQLVVTGMHLSPEFGLTYKEIAFPIKKKVELLLSSDTATALSKSVGLGCISFAEAFEELEPDVVVVLGDRFEIFSAVSAAMFLRIPVSHIHGGERTEGLIDESIRHSISKMSHLHFTASEEYRKRVIQLGEQPERVYNVGGLGVDNIINKKFMSKEELCKSIHFDFDFNIILVTLHPVTLEKNTSEEVALNLIKALDTFKDYKIIFTGANADTDGRIINKIFENYAMKNKDRAIYIMSLGLIRYLSLLQYVSVVIGNSSSGLAEVPSFKKPTVNIGDRQKGRLMAKSVVQCGVTIGEIQMALKKSLSDDFKSICQTTSNPYGDGNTSTKIVEILKSIIFDEELLKKEFYDLS